jgi:hypothetical protein
MSNFIQFFFLPKPFFHIFTLISIPLVYFLNQQGNMAASGVWVGGYVPDFAVLILYNLPLSVVFIFLYFL